MESKQFSKLVKECKLIDKKFNINDVDIVFSKVKVKGLKTITFPDFDRALAEIAKKGKTKESIVETIQKMDLLNMLVPKPIISKSMMIKIFILESMQEEDHLLLMLEEVEWLAIFNKLAIDQLLTLEVLSKNKYDIYQFKFNLNII